jgi:hypothetical protein
MVRESAPGGAVLRKEFDQLPRSRDTGRDIEDEFRNPLVDSPSWQKIHRRGSVDESGQINMVSAPELIFGKRPFTNDNRNMIHQPSVA